MFSQIFKRHLKCRFNLNTKSEITMNQPDLCIPPYIFSVIENFGNCYAGSVAPPPTHTHFQSTVAVIFNPSCHSYILDILCYMTDNTPGSYKRHVGCRIERFKVPNKTQLQIYVDSHKTAEHGQTGWYQNFVSCSLIFSFQHGKKKSLN